MTAGAGAAEGRSGPDRPVAFGLNRGRPAPAGRSRRLALVRRLAAGALVAPDWLAALAETARAPVVGRAAVLWGRIRSSLEYRTWAL